MCKPTLSIVIACLLGSSTFSGEKTPDRTPVEQKLIGEWKGESPCAGDIVFRADGTYQRTGYGPGLCDSKGTWKVRCDSKPAVLILKCTSSDVREEIGRATELKLSELDGKKLSLEQGNKSAGVYERK